MATTTQELPVQASPHTQEGVAPIQQGIQQNVNQLLVHDAIKSVFGVEGADVIPASGQSPVMPEHGMEHPSAEQPLQDIFQNLRVLAFGEKIGEGEASEFADVWEVRRDDLPAGMVKEEKR